MRLWFTGRRPARRRAAKHGRRAKSPALRVRQLERRRVLDAAVQSLMVTPVTTTVTQDAPVAPTATDQPPLTFDWTSATDNAAAAAAGTDDLPVGVPVDNVEPTLVVALPQFVDEGAELDLSGAEGAPPLAFYVDPNLPDTHTATVDWGDGSTIEMAIVITEEGVGAGSIGGKHVYADDGIYSVTVTVTDGVDTVSDSFDVTVNNRPPVLVGPLDQIVDEGQPLDLSGMNEAPTLGLFVDPGFNNESNPNLATPAILDPTHETFTYDIDWGDGRDAATGLSVTDVFPGGPGVGGEPPVPTTGIIRGSHVYADDGKYKVTVTVHDDNGGVDSVEFFVTVNNRPPVLVGPLDQIVDEGQPLDLSGMNGAPTLGLFVDPGFNNESNPNLATPAILDPTHETFTYDIDWGDGRDAATGLSVTDVFPGGPGVGGEPPVPTTGIIRGSHVYADDGKYKVTVTVHDDNGGVDSVEFFVTVNNRPPVLVGPLDQIVDEGQPLDLSGMNEAPTLGLFVDPGFNNESNPNLATPAILDPTHETFTYDIDWGDGRDAATGLSVTDVFPGGPGVGGEPPVPATGIIRGSHVYADDGKYKVTVTVHDDNGGVDSVEFFVTVNNRPPVLVGPLDQIVDEGQPLDLSGMNGAPTLGLFVDPGFNNESNPNLATPAILDPTHETFTYDIDWGDGRDAATGLSVTDVFPGGPGVGGEPPVPTTGIIRGSHVYADDGKYKVTVTVHDDNGGVDSVEFFVTVNNRPPVLVGPLDQIVDEGQPLDLSGMNGAPTLGLFVDPGFNNESNPNLATPAILDPTHETFTYDIDWGDGRDAATGLSVTDVFPGGPGVGGEPPVPTTGIIRGSHVYADDGKYKVTVTVHDDNGGVDSVEFFVTVNNRPPSITGPLGNLQVNEGQPFVLSDLGAATFNLGLGITDPGFDNLSNPNLATPAIPDPTHETFSGVTINWGDGTSSDALTVVSRTSDLIDGPTTALFKHTPHVYADNGDYTATITAFDDNGGQLAPQQIVIHVKNVAPTLNLTDDSFSVDEGSVMHIPNLGSFADPGFSDAANNPPSVETFTYWIAWGDGSTQTGLLPATVVNGARPNIATPELTILTTGTLANSHLYADNDADNLYTITVRLADDDMSGQFTSGVDGIDFVEKQIVVRVLNVNPTLQPLTATDVETTGRATITMTFSDPGADTFPVLIDWGDKLSLPPAQRFVVETTLQGPGTYTFEHIYAGPPDPLHPTADILITAIVHDDDFGTPGVFQIGTSLPQSISISNPGITVVNVRIDTTPDVPRLEFVPPLPVQVVLTQQSNSMQGLQTTSTRVVTTERKTTSERYLELVVVAPDGREIEHHRLKDEAIFNLRALFASLPDNRYRIYLVRSENNSRRLVIDVIVRRGRVIDPSDDSEGTRDRPPTSETPQQDNAVPLNQNPFLDQDPNQSDRGAAVAPETAGEQQANGAASPIDRERLAPQPPDPRPSVSRWTATLAGLGLVANRGSWSQQIDAALERADDNAWQRLRRAGRLGKANGPEAKKRSAATADSK